MTQIEYPDFEKVVMALGTVLSAETNPKARKPAYVLSIDFGAQYGIRTSSAQLTQNYTADALVGMQVVAVMNFPVRRIAGVESQVLVLGAMHDTQGVVLLTPTLRVEDGTRIG